MKATFFSGKKSLQIISPQIQNEVKSLISNIGSFNLNSKYYTFLNKKNVNTLKENDFLVSLSTFGKKFVLFITKYNTKKYCIFINKKNEIMNVTQLKFDDEIFNGTLFDGELVKNSNDKWIFIINDIAYYKGQNVITKSFLKRNEIIEHILKNEYQNDEVSNNDQQQQQFFISKKNYFEFDKINDLVTNYITLLNYKCSGLYFKSINNYSDNYLFIFPECRSDSQILNNGFTVKLEKENPKTSIEVKEKKIENDEDDIFNDVDIIPANIISSVSLKLNESSFSLEKKTCRFLIEKTIMPDIYELYCLNNNNIQKHSYASVPDINTSDFIKSLFNNKSKDPIYVECNYHKAFKKWIPFKKVENMDSNNNINEIQINLDSV